MKTGNQSNLKASRRRLMHYLNAGRYQPAAKRRSSWQRTKKMRLTLIALSLTFLIIGLWGALTELIGL